MVRKGSRVQISKAAPRGENNKIKPAGVYFLFLTNGVAAKPGVLHEGNSQFVRTLFLFRRIRRLYAKHTRRPLSTRRGLFFIFDEWSSREAGRAP